MARRTLFSELKRRNVYKVAIAYGVIAWLLVEIAMTLLPGVDGATGLLTTLVVVLVLGFLVIIYISWAFEATPDGLKRTATVPPDMVLPSLEPS